ncbi:hypothetical protein BS329_09890 [Amycolatopsis coloradensis]|uniref:Uncharacterized protein n=1 Tax=Amycolatopsis coloradensis TaxID=76021 RepID=A0A1R0KW09_9PSEU|nr:hypothetical protein [Amycolatopsis coloradensis]OLZ53132.1 hypothetical protein BS329_09890 [Amycolatopsis coloradensis]
MDPDAVPAAVGGAALHAWAPYVVLIAAIFLSRIGAIFENLPPWLELHGLAPATTGVAVPVVLRLHSAQRLGAEPTLAGATNTSGGVRGEMISLLQATVPSFMIPGP